MNQNKNKHIIIIGGGAAGLMAGIIAARNNVSVTILEKNPRVGKKILATGNGRCNYTNIDIDISRYHGRNAKFALGALKRFDNQRTIDFFSDLGIHPKIEGPGKVYPRSLQASAVLDVLRYELENRGVRTLCNTEVVEIEPSGGSFRVFGKEGNMFEATHVIIAPGGKAAPNLGSDGSGYILAENMGHKTVNPFPSLTKIKLKGDFLKQLAGVKIESSAEVLLDNESIAIEKGEILFTNYGVSGPPILQLSRHAGELLLQGKKPILKIILIDDMTEAELNKYISCRLMGQSQKPLDFSFIGFLNKQLTGVILKQTGIMDIHKPAKLLTPEEHHNIIKILQNWTFEITGLLPWSQAQATAGGVDVGQINPGTMESKIISGLFFAGEVLDIDGDSGGFNLQWAWSSGYVAGESASRGIN